MKLFRRYYLLSATILCANVVFSTVSRLSTGQFSILDSIVPIIIGALTLAPVFRSGGIIRNPRLAIGLSITLTVVFALGLGFVFLEFVRTKGGEGPQGEGSPLGAIVAMTFFAALFLCPWLLTTLRGLPLWKYREQTEPCLMSTIDGIRQVQKKSRGNL